MCGLPRHASSIRRCLQQPSSSFGAKRRFHSSIVICRSVVGVRDGLRILPEISVLSITRPNNLAFPKMATYACGGVPALDGPQTHLLQLFDEAVDRDFMASSGLRLQLGEAGGDLNISEQSGSRHFRGIPRAR